MFFRTSFITNSKRRRQCACARGGTDFCILKGRRRITPSIRTSCAPPLIKPRNIPQFHPIEVEHLWHVTTILIKVRHA